VVVCDIPIALLTGDAPECQWEKQPYRAEKKFKRPAGSLKDLALSILSHPDVAGKEWVYEQYDHDVQLRTLNVGKEAAVLRLEGKALVLSCGCNPRHIYLSPYAGTANAVVENVSNLACHGATPLCLVDCLNFASPVHPNIYWQLEQCTRGLGDMSRTLGIPVVGGNVSLYNESDEYETQIKPTPSLGLVGKGDIHPPLSPYEGNELALAGKTGSHYGGSVLDAVTGCGGTAPGIADPSILPSVRSLVERRAVCGVTDLSHGGLIAALYTLAPHSIVDMKMDLFQALFSESYGRFLLAFRNESQLSGLEYSIIGEVGGKSLKVKGLMEELVFTPDELREANTSLTRMMRHAWQ
jgi:phosphoribosylformylglycinamidine synthase